MVDDADAVRRRDDRQRFVFLGERQAGRCGGGGEGRNAGDRFNRDRRRLFADDAGEVAEGGKGRGVPFDEKDDIVPCRQQFDRLLRGARPGFGQCVGVARHGENQFDGIGGNA